jgi:predicted nucleotidyltransferase
MMTVSRFEKERVDEATFTAVLGDVVGQLEELDLPHVLIGGVASAALGRPRRSDDIDVLVAPRDAEPLLAALAGRGFETEQTYPQWLFKAQRDHVLVDVIFCAGDTVYLDEEMLERSRTAEFQGRTVRVASPEDVLITKVASHTEGSAHYWHDALSLISHDEMDWDYLVRRSRLAARRVLSLLVYAQSEDLLVPDQPIRALFEEIYGASGARGAQAGIRH